MNNHYTILAIETSFDETAAAVIENGTLCYANIVSSQIPLHARFGGTIPEIAARAHVESILTVIEQALTKAYGAGDPRAFIRDHIDAIAVTVGPGLVGSLLVGVSTARSLAASLDKPLIPVNHMMGHLYSNALNASNPYPFPFLTLIASGGHTELILSQSHTNHQLLGQTRDDAAGEAFDKAAHLIGLSYPGGPAISRAAETGNASAYQLPRGMAKDKSLDFSFSGLKTALAQLIRDLAASFQASVVDSLVQKTMAAADQYAVSQINLAGGVAANTTLRHALKEASERHHIPFATPDFEFCTDNAAMVGAAAYPATLERSNFPWYDVRVERHPQLSIYPLTSHD